MRLGKKCGTKLVVPFFKTNVFAVLHSLPNFSVSRKLVMDEIMIWDNSQKVANKTIEVAEPVVNIHFTKRWLIVVHATKVYAYRISKDYTRHVIFEQREFADSKVSQIAAEDDTFGILLLNSRSGGLKRPGERTGRGRGNKGVRHSTVS